MKKRAFEISVIVVFLFLVLSSYQFPTTGKATATAVSISEEQISIPGAPRSSYTKVNFENNYVKVSFLPEIGGRVYEFINKATGKNQFYKNPVYKTTNWGQNNCKSGGWIALGGIEFALPDEEHGATYDVPWTYTKWQDGANAVIEMAKDNINTACTGGSSTIRATVRITLGPNDKFFTLYTKVENTGSGTARFQYWIGTLVAPSGSNNAKASNTKFDYQTSRMQIHSTSIPGMPGAQQEISWPVYNGKDYSVYDNWKTDGWLGVFAVSTPNSVAAYSQNNGEGVRRTLISGSPRGIKLFGLGNINPSVYTSDGSNYIEMWSGLTKTFWDYTTLGAGSNIEWTEKWELIGIALPPTTTTTTTPPPSGRSKLSIQTAFVHSDAMPFIENAKPAVAKLLGGYDKAARIKSVSPCTFIVGRIYEASQPTDGDAVTRAREWFNRNKATIQSAPQIDCWEGYNEIAVWNDVEMRWHSDFESERVRQLASIGAKACIGTFSVGHPGDLALWPYFYPAIETAKQYGGYLNLHEYAAPNMRCMFEGNEGWLTGRYRKIYKQYLIPNNLAIPLIITETGIDGGVCNLCNCNNCLGDAENLCGWRNYMPNSNDYLNELKWYDSLLKQDSYVIGATIFHLGLSGWRSFEIAPELTTSLTNYINEVPAPVPPNCPVPVPPPTATGSISGSVKDSGTGQGISGATVTISTMSGTTDNNGDYSISNIPVGTYTVTASATGYIAGSIANVQVRENQNTPNINFRLNRLPPAEQCTEQCGYIDSAANSDRLCINRAVTGQRYTCNVHSQYGVIKNACDKFDTLCFPNPLPTWSECNAFGDAEKSGPNGITEPKGTVHDVNGHGMICMPVNNYYESWVQCGGSLLDEGVLKQHGDSISDGSTTYYCCNNRWQTSPCTAPPSPLCGSACNVIEGNVWKAIGTYDIRGQCIETKKYYNEKRCCIDKDCAVRQGCASGVCATPPPTTTTTSTTTTTIPPPTTTTTIPTTTTTIPAFDFSIFLSPSNLILVQGSSGTSSVRLTLLSGSTTPVSLSASSVPAGSTISFAPVACNPTCTSTMTIATSSAALGTYTIIVTGTGGSRTKSATLTLNIISADTTPPTGSVSINNDAIYTTSRDVTLSLSCFDESGCSEMKISNDGSSWSTFAYSATKAWTLTAGDGIKTVYVKFKDRAGNWMQKPASPFGVTIIPANFPTPSPGDVENAVALTREIGSHTASIGQWKDFNVGIVRTLINVMHQKGLKIIVAISPTTLGHSRCKVDAPAGIPKDFSDPTTKTAFKNIARQIADLNPDGLALATEINYLLLCSDPADRQQLDYFVSLYNEAYREIKQAHPNLPVFVTFQYDVLRNNDQWQLIGYFQQDLIGFATYPSTGIPADYYSVINRQLGQLPVYFMEMGVWARNAGEEAAQKGFVERLPGLFSGLNLKWATWALLHDVRFFNAPIDYTGLRYRDSTPKQSYGAAKNLIMPSDTIVLTATLPGKIVFLRAAQRFELWVVNDDKTGLREIYEDASATARTHSPPAFSPDGRWVAFQENVRLKKIDVDTGDVVSLTDTETGHPDWSPDGTKIIYCNHRDSAIWIMNSDGTGKRRLFPNPGFEACDPEWSPDGTKIAFSYAVEANNPDSKAAIGIIDINPDGTNPGNVRRLTNPQLQRHDSDPTWSPDSTYIAFNGYEGVGKWWDHSDVNWSIFKVDLNGAETRLTSMDPANPRNPVNFLPVFSPDGSEIMFTSTRSPAGFCPIPVYRMRPDGTEQHLFWGPSTVLCSTFFDWLGMRA